MHPVEVRLEVPLAMWKGNNAFTDHSKAFTGLALYLSVPSLYIKPLIEGSLN